MNLPPEAGSGKVSRMLARSAALLLITLFSSTFASTELIMLEEHGCVYCEKFNQEIGPVYEKTDEGKRAPLRRIFLHDTWPLDLAAVRPDTVTPTFILVSDKKEVGRLRGYRGDEFFWFLLGKMLNQLPNEETPDSTQGTEKP